MGKRTRITIVIAIILAGFPIGTWAICYRRTDFSRIDWMSGPGWVRWRMKDDTMAKIEHAWITKDQIRNHLGEPDVDSDYHWRYKLKNQHPFPIDSFLIMIDFDHDAKVTRVARIAD